MPKAARTAAVIAALFAAGPGCRKPAPLSGEATEAHVTRAPAPAPEPARAGGQANVPGGTFEAGSVPGEPGRRPDLEQRRTEVKLGPFAIDRLPYPNDPNAAPKTSVTRDEAERLCEERGERLCTELEWERACRGPGSRAFATGDAWETRCASAPAECASPFGALGMGAGGEWTSSDVALEGGARKAAVRGAAKSAAPETHRCAARTAERVETKRLDLGFRCCKGPKNAAIVEEPHAGQTFVQAALTPARVAELLKADSKTAKIANDVRFFKEPDSAETVVSRGPGDRKGFLFTVAPLLWSPVAGSEFLIVAGRSGEDTSFVVVFHVMDKDEYKLASSFIMENEVGPVALAYNGYIKPRLHFSTCWGCPGETGKILYRDPDGAIIVQP